MSFCQAPSRPLEDKHATHFKRCLKQTARWETAVATGDAMVVVLENYRGQMILLLYRKLHDQQ